MDGQDWKTVTVGRPKTLKDALKKGETTVVSKPGTINPSGGHLSMSAVKKLEDDDAKSVIITVGRDNGVMMQKARTEKKLSQVDLARALSIDVAIIKHYEDGTAKWDGATTSKINRHLGITLVNPKKK